MEAFNDLRRAARDKRDKIINDARDDYGATLKSIAGLEQRITGRSLSKQKSIAACVSSLIPSDAQFTSQDILHGLEALAPHRHWRRRAINHCITRLLARGILRRISRARVGARHHSSPAVYVRVGIEVQSDPFGDMQFSDVLYEVLHGHTMRLTELVAATLEAGYRTNQRPRDLRHYAGRVIRADRRFRRTGERWEC
jgi:hypothetical protein